jgi:DnaJ-class molecular chaperone
MEKSKYHSFSINLNYEDTVTCSACHGSGEHLYEDKSCEECDGTGEILE